MRKNDFIVKRLKRDEINDENWNMLVEQAQLSKSYNYSWYLDIVSPNWQALVLNDYEAAFVLPIKSKFGIKYLVQPNFVQQLGCISKEDNKEFLFFCLKYIKKHFFHYVINLNEVDTQFVTPSKKDKIMVNVTKKIAGNESDFKSYNNNTKRNIAKFHATELKIVDNESFRTIINLFKNDKGSELNLDSNFYATLIKLFTEVEKQNKMIVCSATNGDKIIAGAVFISTPKTATFIFSGNSEEGKKHGAMHAIIDHFIKTHLSAGQTLDFEGSINENLARFYLGFGGEKREYLQIRR